MEIKEITFNTAIYNNVTDKLKCLQEIWTTMRQNYYTGMPTFCSEDFFPLQVPYLRRALKRQKYATIFVDLKCYSCVYHVYTSTGLWWQQESCLSSLKVNITECRVLCSSFLCTKPSALLAIFATWLWYTVYDVIAYFDILYFARGQKKRAEERLLAQTRRNICKSWNQPGQ